MSESNRVGPIVTANQAERAVVAFLDDFLDFYLAEIEREEGYDPGSIQRPRAIVTLSDFEKMPEDQVPAILVLNAGLARRPQRHADGQYEATWLVGIAPIVSDPADVRKLGSAYAAAIRAAMAQHKALKSSLYPEGWSNALTWVDERLDDIGPPDARYLFAAQVMFEIGKDRVMLEAAGPREVPETNDDPGPWPEVTERDVEIELEALT